MSFYSAPPYSLAGFEGAYFPPSTFPSLSSLPLCFPALSVFPSPPFPLDSKEESEGKGDGGEERCAVGIFNYFRLWVI